MTAILSEDRFLHLVVLATILSAFFALLWRDEGAARRRLFARMWLSIVGGSIAAAWAMSLVGSR